MNAPKAVHLNCGTMRPYGFWPFSTIPINGTGRMFGKGLGVIHCLLVDTGESLALVDSGYGLRDYSDPSPLVRWFNRMISMDTDPEQTAIRQVEARGYDPEQVTDIFLTHMHLDHTGGLVDFPWARVHVYRTEHQAAMERPGLVEKFACRPEHYAHNPECVLYDLLDEPWHGLARTNAANLNGVEIFFIPLVGHSRGHSAVVIKLPCGRYIIHGGDSYGYHGQVARDKISYPPLSYLIRPIVLAHPATRALFRFEHKLRALLAVLPEDTQIFCSHDPHEFEIYKEGNLS